MSLKFTYGPDAIKESESANFKGGGKAKRLWSIFAAHLRCYGYLIFKFGKAESFFKGWENDSVVLIGTSTGSLWDGTLVITHIFWCQV